MLHIGGGGSVRAGLSLQRIPARCEGGARADPQELGVRHWFRAGGVQRSASAPYGPRGTTCAAELTTYRPAGNASSARFPHIRSVGVTWRVVQLNVDFRAGDAACEGPLWVVTQLSSCPTTLFPPSLRGVERRGNLRVPTYSDRVASLAITTGELSMSSPLN